MKTAMAHVFHVFGMGKRRGLMEKKMETVKQVDFFFHSSPRFKHWMD